MADSQESSTKLRDHYLQTLGIVQYVPRDFVQEVVVDTSVEETPVVENTAITNPIELVETKPDQQSTIEALMNTDGEDSPVKKSAKGVKTQEKTEQQTKKLTLQFVFWQPTDELLIATAVDHELPNSQQLTLLTNIVNAIDNQVSVLPQYDSVNWPPHASMQGGEQEAREFMSTLINSRLAVKSTKLLLILGESAENWLLSSSQKTMVQNGLLSMSPEIKAIIAPSLPEMLNKPQSKRLTWQMICQYFDQQNVTN